MAPITPIAFILAPMAPMASGSNGSIEIILKYIQVPYRLSIIRLSILGHTPLPFSEYIIHSFVNLGTSEGHQKCSYMYQWDTYRYLHFSISKAILSLFYFIFTR